MMPPFDFKQAYFDLLNHRPTQITPSDLVCTKVMGFGAINGPWIEKGRQFGDRLDGFGNLWEYPASGGGAGVPDVSVIPLDDVTEWREKVTIPDPSQYDWRADYAMECQMIGEPDREHQAVVFGFGNGVFERLAALLGFEECLCSMISEPEETYALAEAITDYKVAALDCIIDAYHPDCIMYYDDVATERNLFMSPDTYREIIKPHHKRFAQECLKRGIYPIYHCCGHAEELVEDMIDCGWVAWSSVQISNDIEGLIEKYGDRLSFIGGFDSNGPVALEDATDEMVDAEVKRCIDTYGRFGRAYSFFGFRYPNSTDPERVMAMMMPLGELSAKYVIEAAMARGAA